MGVNIGNDDITGATIDGQPVSEITVDGEVVFEGSIVASGGQESTVSINGQTFKQHKFTGNSNYIFTVDSIGINNGLVQYEIVGDGSDRNSSDDNVTAGLDVLNGNILRKVDPFFDNNTIFEHTSKTTNLQSHNISSDSTINSEAEVNGSCRNNDFPGGVSQHYASDDGRMPTLEEYINDGTTNSGCGHDNEINWTATKDHDTGTTSSHWVSWGDMDSNNNSGYPQVKSNGNNNFLRQVADDDLNRPDPVILQDDDILQEVQANNYPYTIVDGPKVESGKTYDLTLGQGTASDKIPHTGKQVGGSVCGVENQGTVIVRYPI